MEALPRVDAMFHKMSDLIFDARQGKKAAVEKLEKFMVRFKQDFYIYFKMIFTFDKNLLPG